MSHTVHYLLRGIACLAIGGYITNRQIGLIKRREKNQLGFSYVMLGAGLIILMSGIAFLMELF